MTINVSTSKTTQPATYKQFALLRELDNVELDMNGSQFMKRVSKFVASDAISAALDGDDVEFIDA